MFDRPEIASNDIEPIPDAGYKYHEAGIIVAMKRVTKIILTPTFTILQLNSYYLKFCQKLLYGFISKIWS